MPRTVTVTFSDGSQHTYAGVPDNATPAQVAERAGRDFAGKTVTGLDGGRPAATSAAPPAPAFGVDAGGGIALSPAEAKQFMTVVSRAPGAFAAGAGQLVTRLGNKLGLVSDEYRDNYEQVLKERRAALNESAGDQTAEMADLVSGFIPIGGTAMTAERAGGKLLSYLWNLGKAGAAGGTVAGTSYTPEDTSKLGQVAVGMAFPFATQAVAGAGPAARNIIASAIKSVDQAAAPRIRAALADAQRFWQGSQVQPEPYTLAQTSGNPVIQRLELQARGPQMAELQARQLDQTALRFQELANAADAGLKAPAAELAGGAHRMVYSLSREMKSIANQGYERGMNQVIGLSAGSTQRIPTPNLQAAYKAILAERNNVFSLAGEDIPDVQKAFSALQKLDKSGPDFAGGEWAMARPVAGADVPTIAEMLKGLNAGVSRGQTVLSSQQAQVNRVSHQLREALDKDLDAAIAARQGVPGPEGQRPTDALAKLQQVRQEYAVRRQAIERLENDSITKLFGDAEVLANPRQALQAFYNLQPEDMAYAVRTLQDRAPGVLAGMRSDRLRSILAASNKTGPAGESTFDADQFRQLMYNGQDGVVNVNLWDDATRARLIEGSRHLAVIQNSLTGLGGTPVAPSDVAINLVSMNPAFMTRLVTRVAYGSFGDELLGTEAGLRALRSFSQVQNSSKQAQAQAAAWLLSQLEAEQEE